MRSLDEFIVLFSIVASVSCRPYTYILDDPNVCRAAGVVTKWIGADDYVLVYGKRSNNDFHHNCMITFGPDSSATKMRMMLQFLTFSIKDCSTFLAVQESPHSFFKKDVRTLFNLTCHSQPGERLTYTKSGHNVRIQLVTREAWNKNYNFMLNITLVKDKEEIGGFSTGIMVGIGVLVAIAIPGVGCIVYRYMKIKRWSKRQYEQEQEPSPQSLNRLSHHSTPPSVRYSTMPVGVTDATGSQICVVGSRDADGLCTVCGRVHEDFAHIIDVSADNQIHDMSSRDPECQLCRQNQADFAYIVDVNGSAHIVNSNPPVNRHAPTCPNRQNDMLHSARPRSGGQLAPVRGHIRADGWLSDENDDDIDLSGNDLIPPSYDLSPPSYDEAVSMPKPEELVPTLASTQVPAHVQEETTETDPLYQNIESLTSDDR